MKEKYATSRVQTCSSEIVKELLAAAIIPPQCTRFVLEIDVSKAIKITTERFAAPEDLVAIKDAFLKHPDEVAEMVRENIVKQVGTAAQ